MKRGIFIACSARNGGPSLYIVQNVGPWIMTVGASSIDRQFRTPVKLGNTLQTDVSRFFLFGMAYKVLLPKKKKKKFNK